MIKSCSNIEKTLDFFDKQINGGENIYINQAENMYYKCKSFFDGFNWTKYK